LIPLAPLKKQGCFILKRKKVETLKSRCILIRYSLSRNKKIGFEILLSKMKQPCPLKRGEIYFKVPLKKGDLGGSPKIRLY
jgi:hypothetical protein